MKLRVRNWIRALGPLLGLIVVWCLFAGLTSEDAFTRWSNQRLMLVQTAVVGTAAVGATLIIIAGGIDLSVGSTIAVATMVIALLLRAETGPTLAAGGGVAGGLLVGLVIGALVIGHAGRVAAGVLACVLTWWLTPHLGLGGGCLVGLLGGGITWALSDRLLGRVPLSPFIVTLGLWGALRGLAKGLGDNQPIYPPGQTWLNGLMSEGSGGLTALLPSGVWVMLVVAAVFALVLARTRFGRHVFAIGSNEETARLCGIRVDLNKVVLYALAGGCAGLAGVLQFSFLSMGDPTTAQGYELKVIAAVVIGGASLTGGEGSIRGTLVGALLMTVVDNGCTKLGLDNWVQEIVTGAIIVGAVTLDQLRHRK